MSYATTILAEPDLVAFWTFAETSGVFADASGSGDLTAAGGVTRGAAKLLPTAGDAAATFSRAGSGRASRGASYPEAGVTVEGWFRCDDLTTIRQVLWRNGSGTNGNALVLNGADALNGKLWLLVVDVGWIALTFEPDNDVHHIVFTRAAIGGLVTLYVDGEEVHAQNVGQTAPPSGGFTIGAEDATGSNGFNGAVDDVSVYDVALDAATVSAHYYSGSGESPPVEPEPTREELLAEWRENLFWPHRTGVVPYVVHAPIADATEHYDPLVCFINARDYCLRYGVTPSDWSTEIANALAVWRDQLILIDAAGGQLSGRHTHTHGLARHYLETSEPESLAALVQIHPATVGLGEAGYRRVYEWVFSQRENALKLMACLDYDLVGEGEHESVHWAVDCALRHCEHFIRTPSERYGVFVRPFMWGLILRSLIYYWFRYRDSADATAAAFVAQIPAAVEASVSRMMEIAYWPEGTAVPLAFDGDPEGWSHGAVYYISPDGTEYSDPGGSSVPITGLVIAARESSDTFIGPVGLSAVDDYYKGLQYVGPGLDASRQAYVLSYEGSTRRFVIRATWGGAADVTAGDTFELHPDGWSSGGDPPAPAPDGASPALSPLVAPAAAWCYWHRKVVLDDAAGAAVFREHHEAIWSGQKMTWKPPFSQKEYNEGLIVGPIGEAWCDAGDAGVDTVYDALTQELPDPDPPAARILIIPAPAGRYLLIPQGDG